MGPPFPYLAMQVQRRHIVRPQFALAARASSDLVTDLLPRPRPIRRRADGPGAPGECADLAEKSQSSSAYATAIIFGCRTFAPVLAASVHPSRRAPLRFAKDRGADEWVRPYTRFLITVTLLYATRSPRRSALRCEIVPPWVTTTAYSHPASRAACMRARKRAVCRPRPR